MYNSPVLAWKRPSFDSAAAGSSSSSQQQQQQSHQTMIPAHQVSIDEEYSQPSDARGYVPAPRQLQQQQQQSQAAHQCESFYSEPTPATAAPVAAAAMAAAIGFRPIQPAGGGLSAGSFAAKPLPAKVPTLSVLNHHPASPFEPVQQRVKPMVSGAAPAGRPSTVISAQPLTAERLPASAGAAAAGTGLYGDPTDSSYEEAWDIRMQKRGITLGGRPPASSAAIAASTAAPVGVAPPAAAAGPGEPDYDYAYGSGGGELRHAMQRSLSLQDHQGSGGGGGPALPARSGQQLMPMLMLEQRRDEDRVSIGSYDEPWEGGGAAAAAVGRAFLPVETHRTAAQTVQKPVVPGFPIAVPPPVPPPVPPHKSQPQPSPPQPHQQQQTVATAASGSPPVRLRSSATASGGAGATSVRQSHPAPLTRQESGAAASSSASSEASQIDASLPLAEQPWFYEVGVNRQSAESMLKAYPEGAFLVRTCESDASQYSLSLRGRSELQYLHMKIERNKVGQFVLGQYSQPFQSVPQMIRHYTSNILPIKGADQMILKLPVLRTSSRRGQPAGNNHYV